MQKNQIFDDFIIGKIASVCKSGKNDNTDSNRSGRHYFQEFSPNQGEKITLKGSCTGFSYPKIERS